MIVVSGFPTAGKSTVGRFLENDYGHSVLDLDAVIEQSTGKPIKEIFRVEGEAAFRKLENKFLRDALEKKIFSVITVGGGTFTDSDNQKLLKNCQHIALDVAAAVAAKRAHVDEEDAVRLGAYPKRPLLSPVQFDANSRAAIEEKVVLLKAKRQELIDSANIRIDTTWVSAADVAWVLNKLIVLGDANLNCLIIPVRFGTYKTPELIVIGEKITKSIRQLLLLSECGSKRCAFAIDANVAKNWTELLSQLPEGSSVIEVAAGEKSKRLTTVEQVCENLAKSGFRREDALAAVGGGVVGDVVGLCASLYMRGISLVQIPTTVVAQVDSAIGGKTGVNLESGKNLVGTFEPAKLIASDIGFLSTLPDREFNAGLAEVIKYGLIYSREFFDWLVAHSAQIVARDSACLLRIVEWSTRAKLSFVQSDLRDISGLRAQLNFGHTVGHAIETLSQYGSILHGEAVSIGMIAACRVGELLGITDPTIRQRADDLLRGFNLPTRIPQGICAKESGLNAWAEVILRDKKRTSDSANFVILEKLGRATCVDVRLDVILEAIDSSRNEK